MFTLALVTSTRADYGLLRPVLEKLHESECIKTVLLVTGTHLSKAFGETEHEIIQDGFNIDERLDFLAMPAPCDTSETAIKALHAQQLFTNYFIAKRPNCALVLGDRYEILAAATAASLLDIPLVHISGGDVTYGATDDWYRHCITKMAKLHFPSCEVYRQRLIRMGEQPQTVFNVGGLGDENIRKLPLLTREELEKSISFKIDSAYCLVTFHPETATLNEPKKQLCTLLDAILQNMNLRYIFTKANADAGGELLNAALEQFCKQHPENTALFASLGALRYLSAMKHAALVLGNSSSGLVETPSFGTPTVNIGVRQEGRVRSNNIIDCALNSQAISDAIKTAQSAEFVIIAKNVKSPYDGGQTSEKIVKHLEEALKNGNLQNAKIFYDEEAQE